MRTLPGRRKCQTRWVLHALPLVEDGEVDAVFVACSDECFVQVPTSRWFVASCDSDGSLVIVRPIVKWRELTPARTRRAMLAPIWEAIAGQLRIFKHPLMAAFVFVSVVTHMRPSEVLALPTEDPPLPPMLACWPIETSETGISRKTSVRDGSIVMDHVWLQLVGDSSRVVGRIGVTRPLRRCLRKRPSLWGSVA